MGREMQNKVLAGGVAAALASGNTESVEFLNEIMVSMQPYLRVAVSTMIRDTVEPMFKEMLPGPLKTLHFTKVDIGATPFVFSEVDVEKVKSRSGADSLTFEMNVTWDGDLDVTLDADLVPEFGVRHVKFFGRISVLLRPLVPALPLISAMAISLINPPELEMDFTGAAQALDLSIIDDTVRSIIQSVIAGMMVLPNRMIIKIDPTCELYSAYLDPVAVLRVKVESGSGFKSGGRFIKDVPDLYCKVKMGANADWQTSTKDNSEAPEWMESHDYLLSDNDQVIEVKVYDSDIGKDDYIGNGKCTVAQLMSGGGRITLPLTPPMTHEKDESTSITLSASVFDLVSSADSLTAAAEADGSAKTMCGLVTILLAGCKGLTGTAEDLATNVVVTAGDKTFTSMTVQAAPNVVVDVNNPNYDGVFRVELTEDNASLSGVSFALKNKGTVIGEYTVPMEDVLAAEGLALTNEFPVESGGVLRAKVSFLGLKPHAG